MSYQLNLLSIDSTTPIRDAYSRLRLPISFPENGRTKQEFASDCDINVIMARYLAAGELPNIRQDYPQYADATGQDFQEAMNFVAGANSMFQQMPSRIRNRFDNDPGAFIDFCSDERNREEMAQMGLLKPREQWAKVDVPFGAPVDENASQASNAPVSESPAAKPTI